MSRELIAILRGIQPTEVAAVANAAIEEGIEIIEVPLNSPEALKSITVAREKFDGRAKIGAGTVLSPTDVDRVADAGAQFIVSPNVDQAVIGRTRTRGLSSIPGALTPTEAFAAISFGATAIKIFPVTVVGISGVAAMKAVLPSSIALVAVGGVSSKNFKDYAAAGCTGFGLGASIYRPGDSEYQSRLRVREIVRAFDELAIAPYTCSGII